jgi:hypothetical protein
MCRAPSKEVALKATHRGKPEISPSLAAISDSQPGTKAESKESYIFAATLQNLKHTNVNTQKVSWKQPGVWTGGSGTSWNHSALVGGSLWFFERRLLFWSSFLLISEQNWNMLQRLSKKVAREPVACFRDIKEKHQRFPERPWPRGLEASGGPKISLFVCQCGCTQQSLFIVL